jgi:hypothetical protein
MTAPRIDPPHPATLTVSVLDHGAQPDGPCCAVAFAAATAALRAAGGGRLIVPPGTWHLRTAPDPEAGHWTLDDLVDVEVVAHGALLICHRIAHGIRLRRCQRVALRGLSLDWAATLASPARIEADGGRLVLVPAAGAWAGADVPIAGITAWDRQRHGWAMHAAEWYHRAWGPSESLPWDGRRWLLPEQPNDLHAGLDVVVRHWIYHGNGIDLSGHGNCDITLEDLTVLGCPGHAYVGYGCDRGVRLTRCRIARPDDPRRMVTATADGCHLGDMRGDIVIEDCDFAYHGDDSVNIHGLWLRVAALADHAVAVRSRWLDRAQMAAGDGLLLRSRDDLGGIGTATVLAREPHPEGWLLRLDRPVPDGLQIGDYVGNAGRDSARFRIQGNHFHDHRARGMLIQAGHGLIEGNVVEQVQMAALNLTTDCHEWQEGFGCHDVTVRGNVFRDCNHHRRERGERGVHLACVNILVEAPHGIGRQPVHRGLHLAGNRIDGTAGAGILVASCSEVQVDDLRIDSAQADPLPGCGAAIGVPGGAVAIQVGDGCTWTGLMIDGRPAAPTRVAAS